MTDFMPDKAMLTVYLSRRENDLKDLNASLRQGSVEAFQRIGHQLCGNASNFGFLSLATLAKQMEAITPADLSYKGPEILERYSKWLEETQKSTSA